MADVSTPKFDPAPTITALYQRQLRLIESTQKRLEANLENEGSVQTSQALAKTLTDLTSGAQKLESQQHPGAKVDR